jgi:hypothetical protein
MLLFDYRITLEYTFLVRIDQIFYICLPNGLGSAAHFLLFCNFFMRFKFIVDIERLILLLITC